MCKRLGPHWQLCPAHLKAVLHLDNTETEKDNQMIPLLIMTDRKGHKRSWTSVSTNTESIGSRSWDVRLRWKQCELTCSKMFQYNYGGKGHPLIEITNKCREITSEWKRMRQICSDWVSGSPNPEHLHFILITCWWVSSLLLGGKQGAQFVSIALFKVVTPRQE